MEVQVLLTAPIIMNCKEDEKSRKYYDQNYDLVFDYEQTERQGGYSLIDSVTKNLVTNRPFEYQDSSKKCRFCNKTEPEVTFRDKAHTYPEFLGNKMFVSKNNECDYCNHTFGETFEKDLNNLLKPYLSIDKISSKGGRAKYKSFDKTSTCTYEDEILVIKEVSGHNKAVVDNSKKEMTYPIDVPAYSRLNAYKSMLKMGLASIPEDDFLNFRYSLSSLFDDTLHGTEVLIVVFYPGFNFFNFEVTLYRKKKTINDPTIPTYIFAIRNENFMVQVPIFSDTDISQLIGVNHSFTFIKIPTVFDHTDLGDCQVTIYDSQQMVDVPRKTVNATLKYDEIKSN